MRRYRLVAAATLCTLLTACGGNHAGWSKHDDDDDDPAGTPSAPLNLAVNAGDRAISLGWDAPATNGTGSIEYEIALSPSTGSAQTRISGTTALIRGLNNGTTYTLSVTASNSSGTSPAASIQAEPATVATAAYRIVAFTNNPQPTNGFIDPSLLRTSGGTLWMAYSDIDASGSGQLLRSATRLAHSTDGGSSYRYDQEVGTPVATSGLVANGEWHYRTPWLIEDSTDPDANRRFKLFAHKYLYNPLDNSVDYQTGAIAMWTAAAPDQEWSDEEIVLGWNDGTSTALVPSAILGRLDSSLQSCLWVDHGSAAVGANGIDFALGCAIDNTPFNVQHKVVLLRSEDHAKTFSYVATPLQPADAVNFDADSFSMPALLPGGGAAPVLIASPVDPDGNALGCVVFPVADAEEGKLFLDTDSVPLTLQTLPPNGVDSGGCAWDRGIPEGGILMNNRNDSTYTVQATGKSL